MPDPSPAPREPIADTTERPIAPGATARPSSRGIDGARTRLLRAPLLRFLLAGAALYAADLWRRGPDARLEPAAPREIVIGAEQVRRMREQLERDTGLPVGAADEAALIEQAIADELLYREALARGLDRGDRSIEWRLAEKMHFLEGEGSAAQEEPPEAGGERQRQARELGLDRDDLVIRRMLIEKMRLLAQADGGHEPPSEAELRDSWERHRERWLRPATVSLQQVFLSHDARGAALADDARRLLATLRAESDHGQAALRQGDPFPASGELRAQSERQLGTSFGAAFAAAVMALEPGAWGQPIASPYGLHLVRVTERQEATVAPLEAVRSQVRLALEAERRQARVRELLDELRRRWAVRVERPQGARS